MERDTRNWDIKKKVRLIASSIEQNDNDPGFNYFEDLITYYFEDDPDRPLIKEKMDNIMALLNSAANNEDELSRIMDMDFEDEMWYII
jgi:hypothetical protein